MDTKYFTVQKIGKNYENCKIILKKEERRIFFAILKNRENTIMCLLHQLKILRKSYFHSRLFAL
jgi:hypothetical protein